MKKLLFVAILAMASLVSNAQVFIGGGFGAQVMSVSPKEGSSVTTTALTIKPEVGYKFGNAAAGVRGGILYISQDSYDTTTFAIEAFGRYNFINAQRFHLGAELGVGYESYKDAGSAVTVALRPMLTFDLSNKTSLYLNTDLLQYTSKNKEAGNTNIFSAGLLGGRSTVYVGVMFDL